MPLNCKNQVLDGAGDAAIACPRVSGRVVVSVGAAVIWMAVCGMVYFARYIHRERDAVPPIPCAAYFDECANSRK